MILIVPCWHNQSWFPTLLARLINVPLILPNFNQIITNLKGETHQMIAQNSLTLVACKVYGIISKVTKFQMTFKLITAAWRSSTEKYSSSAWEIWVLWCNQADRSLADNYQTCVKLLNSAVPRGKAILHSKFMYQHYLLHCHKQTDNQSDNTQ